MNWKRLKIGFYLALIFWIPATLVLLSILYGSGGMFSTEIDILLMPFYFIGFGLSYAGPEIYGLFGHLLTLFLLTFLMYPISYLFKVEEKKTDV